jgi:predicted transcriptional regulator of viral defense system
MAAETAKPGWTFFTNHGHVLVCLADDPTVRTRDVAAQVGITERAAQGIIGDLVEAGFVTRIKEGRRNRYEVHPERPLRHPLEADHTVGELLVTLGKLPRGKAGSRKAVRR